MSDWYLVHYGIEGQKWGLRRYQYEDGTLTPEGKKRYGSISESARNYHTAYARLAKKRAEYYDNPDGSSKRKITREQKKELQSLEKEVDKASPGSLSNTLKSHDYKYSLDNGKNYVLTIFGDRQSGLTTGISTYTGTSKRTAGDKAFNKKEFQEFKNARINDMNNKIWSYNAAARSWAGYQLGGQYGQAAAAALSYEHYKRG